jgi:hypothetical protein
MEGSNLTRSVVEPKKDEVFPYSGLFHTSAIWIQDCFNSLIPIFSSTTNQNQAPEQPKTIQKDKNH